MSNPTSNFGWQMPTPTDLVTDLPADFEVFGQAVDTSLADLKGGTTGQILSKATNTDMDFVWITNDQGDITGVTAGTGITGGGTSGAVTVSFDQANFGGGQYAAGKNKIINGDFGVWARGTTFTNPSFADYTADRWRNQNYDAAPTTYSITRETFTPGAAPVAGYESQYFFRSTLTTIGSCTIYDTCGQRIEGVLGSNTSMTLSFWAKSDSNRTQGIYWFQNYGSGGSVDASFSVGPTFNTTTAWQRFTFTATSPNNTGKTIGANAYAMMYIRQAAASGSVLDVWGVQVEYGSTATPFQTASGSSGGGELALCQRYFLSLNNANTNTLAYGYGWFFSTTSARYMLPTPVTMRTAPTLTGALVVKGGGSSLAPSSYGLYLLGQGIGVISNITGGVADNAIAAILNSTLTLSAEL